MALEVFSSKISWKKRLPCGKKKKFYVQFFKLFSIPKLFAKFSLKIPVPMCPKTTLLKDFFFP
jgi:hypothetical protein